MAKPAQKAQGEQTEPVDFSGFNVLVADSIPQDVEEAITKPVKKDIKKTEPTKPLKSEQKPPVEDEIEEEEEAEEVEEVENQTKPKKKETARASDDTEDSPTESEGDQPATYRAFAEFLADKGIVDFDANTFEDSETGLASVVQRTIDREVNAYKSALGKDSQKFIEYLENGGDPLKYIQTKASLNYLKVDEKALSENETMQRSVVADLLSKSDYTEEEINEKLKDYEDAGILEKEALRSLKRLKVIQQKEDDNLVATQKAQRQAEIKAYETYISTLEANLSKRTEIAGFPINEREKTKLFEYMTKPVNEQGQTQLIIDTSSDPEMQLNLAWAAYKKFNFSNLEKRAVSEASSKLRNALGRFTDSRQKLNSSTRETDENKADLTIFKKVLNM